MGTFQLWPMDHDSKWTSQRALPYIITVWKKNNLKKPQFLLTASVVYNSSRVYIQIKAHICQWVIFTTHCNVSVYNLQGDMLGFVIVFLVPRALAFVCWKGNSCHYPDTKPLDVSFLDISTKDSFPLSCVGVCSLTDGCIGVTLDPHEAMCHLYRDNASFGLTRDPGKSLWLFQASGVPCIKVR